MMSVGLVCEVAISAHADQSVPVEHPSAMRADTPPSPSGAFTNAPSSARQVVPIFQRAMQLYQAMTDGSEVITQWRTEQDSWKTKLTAISGELDLLTQRQDALQQHAVALEAEQQAQFDALRKELEAKLDQGLSTAAQQLNQELEQALTHELSGFEARQRQEMGKLLDQEIQLEERELQQLTREIELQTKELSHRFAQLEASPEVVANMIRSAEEALANRKAALEARRRRLEVERDARIAKQRDEFLARLKQRQATERERRLTIKEATLRQAMAELLHNTRLQAADRLEQVRQALADAQQRAGRLTQEQASARARSEGLDGKIAEKTKRIGELQAEHQSTLARLEQGFVASSTDGGADVLAWFGQMVERCPPQLATDLGLLQQRVVARLGQEQQLQEQRRILRERQLAMQLTQEMEAQREAALLKRRREQEARARKADELLAKARQLAEREKFDDALQLLAQAQGLNPPQISQITITREELLAAKDAARARAQAAELERLFAHAKGVFEQGRYGEAVTLFEQVIAQEAAQHDVVRLAEGSAP